MVASAERDLVPYSPSEGIYSSGVHRAAQPVPHDCPQCGRQASDPHPAQLVGGCVIDCPRCGPAPMPEKRNAAQQLRADVRDILNEDAARGQGGGRQGGGKARKKQSKARLQVRWEQDVPAFSNGRSSDTVRITRFEHASERVELQISLDCKESLREAAQSRRADDGSPTPMVAILREAVHNRLQHIEHLGDQGYGLRVRLELRMFPSELLLLDRACEHWAASRGAVVEACLREYLELEFE